MIGACPNYHADAWKNLNRHFKNAGRSTQIANNEAHRIFAAHEGALPNIPKLTKIKKDLKFQADGITDLKKNMMLKALGIYNINNNSAHSIKFEPSTPFSYNARLVLNFMPRSLSEQTSRGLFANVGFYSDVEVQTIASPSMVINRNGNEYVVQGEVYPSYEDAENSLMYQTKNKGKSKPIKELNDFLIDILNKNGIKVQNIDNFMERFGIDAVAVSDIAQRMVSVANGREDSTTLPEEAAHFIIELLGKDSSLYKAMDGIIKDTEEYKQVVAEYTDIYKGDEEMLKKEAMGKVLSNYFIKRHKNRAELPIRANNIFSKVFNWFSKHFGRIENTEIEAAKERIFSDVANKLFDGRLRMDATNLTGNKSVFAQSSKLVDSLNSAVDKLRRKSKILSEHGTRGEESGRAEEIKASLDMVAQYISTAVGNGEYMESIVVYMDYIKNSELKFMMKEMNEYKADRNSISFPSTSINEMLDLVQLYESTIGDMKRILAYDEIKEYEELYNKKIVHTDITIADMMKELQSDIAEIKEFAQILHEEKAIDLVEEMKHEDSEYTAEQLVKESGMDLNWLQLNFGSLRNAPDEALRMIYRLVGDIYKDTYREALSAGKNLMRLQTAVEKSGMKDVSAMHEMYKGKKTGFMLSVVNYGEYEIEKKIAIDKVAKKLGFESSFDMKYTELSTDDQKTYHKMMASFKDKYEKQVDGYWQPNPPLNADYKRLMNNKAFNDYYVEFKRIMRDSRGKLPSKYSESKRNQLMMPQMRKDVMQTIKDSEGGVLRKLGSRMKESYISNEEDTEFGSAVIGNGGVIRDINGNVAKLVPIHYTTMIKDVDQLSNDATSMAVKFLEMSLNFNGMANKIDDLTVIQNTMAGRNFEHKNRAGKGSTSNSYKALDQFLDSFVYGKFKDKDEWTIPGTKIKLNMSKIADKLANFVRGNNLFFNIPTTISGYTKAGIDGFIDKSINHYTSHESSMWSEKEFDLHLGEILNNLGKREKTGKVSLMFEHNAVFSDISDTFDRLDIKSKIGRAKATDLIYSTYALVDLRLKGKLALAVYDNYRLVNGKYITKSQFKRNYKDSGKEWSSYKDNTLYDAYEVRNGEFKLKLDVVKSGLVTKDLENVVMNIIKQRGAALDGQLTHMDRPAIAKSIMGRFIMIHRGWLVSGIAERGKSKGINYETGEIEEGFYRSFGRTIASMLTTAGPIKQKLAVWKTLPDYQKRNTMKMIMDLSFSALMVGMASAMNGLVDDDKKNTWWIQYLGFQMNRIRLEQLAFISPTEVKNILNSPSAGLNLLDSATDLMKFATDWEKIEYGAYEDMYHFEKTIIKNSLMKNVWELREPAQKNKYLRSQVL